MIKGRRYNKVLILLVILILALAACSPREVREEDDLLEEEEVEESLISYFPLKQGMVYRFAGEGIEFASFKWEVKFVDDELAQIHEDNGGTVNARVFRVTDDEVRILREEAEFYEDTILLDDLDREDKREEVILKRPIEEGNSWESGGRRREIVKVDKVIDLPAGRFYGVIKVEITPLEEGKDYTNYEYYAKNIGLVMSGSEGEEYKVRSRLRSFGNI
ncbi:hypothetical protein [Halonatronum saccharophilum]|uniref:hypothetical protein n=1 Tax=Halonatronum saccharophilum TaxID=150060 RepID=UPI000485FC35|nr:hypothetical protein [Halonatronum saccharophilum]